jgi:16S rRNA (cytidine1402-2'-O)-methyltransferase
MQGILSIVATPIGNLGDITLRALETLKKADVIACEDTRVTAKLLQRYEIQKPLIIFHARSGTNATTKIRTLLEEGKHIALVTDAGTPGISDPGNELVARVREHFQDEVKIETIPGASALTAALAIAGMPTHEFLFIGFIPHKKGRQTLFKSMASEKRAVVFYESPHRILKTLEALAATLSAERAITVCRELTKIHESLQQGTAHDILAYFMQHADQVRGEFVVIIAPLH